MEVLRIRNNPSEQWQEIAALVGPKGDSYVLTDADKQEIANNVLAMFTASISSTGHSIVISSSVTSVTIPATSILFVAFSIKNIFLLKYIQVLHLLKILHLLIYPLE